jgi:hypothetical protein
MTLNKLQNKKLGEALTREEETSVLQVMKAYNPAEGPHGETSSAISILGKTGNAKYEPLLSDVIRSTSDVHVARSALRALVRHMDLGAKYAPYVLKHLRGLPNDYVDSAKTNAIQLSPDVFFATGDESVLNCLFDIFDSPDETDSIKQEVYLALTHILEISDENLEKKIDDGWSYKIKKEHVEAARNRIGKLIN